MVELE